MSEKNSIQTIDWANTTNPGIDFQRICAALYDHGCEPSELYLTADHLNALSTAILGNQEHAICCFPIESSEVALTGAVVTGIVNESTGSLVSVTLTEIDQDDWMTVTLSLDAHV